jgi:Methyltransferase domain
MKNLIKIILPLADIVLAPFVYLAALLLKAIRQAGIRRMPCCKRALMQVGVFPILNHYYEPLFDSRLLRHPLNQNRDLPGIDWNIDEQLHLLKSFCFNEELKDVPETRIDELTFHMINDTFEIGDAEYLYNLIRLKKPARIIEIGSGNSTLMAIKAIKKNQEEIPGYKCKHLCIEPYEMPWLEKTGVTVIRQRVEEVHKAVFSELEKDDLLFIDSSHIIRPQGDVLFEYLELIPSLKTGVIVHVHDIFSPRDYSKACVVDEVCFWNEQYLLEAFLTCNRDWKVIGALNYLHHNHYQHLKAKCPFLTPDREPGSFYIQKTA